MKTTSIGQRIKEAISGYVDLSKMFPVIKEYKHNPQEFWKKNKKSIYAGIKKRYVITKQPDIEVLIPIHHNVLDLPLLFYGLSQQQINPNNKVGLTVVMHNNQNIRKWSMYDDGSWKIVKELLARKVPIKVLTLTDPLLTGPYMAWQYLIAKSSGEIIAILDADCLPPSQWILRIIKPMEENNKVRFTGGIRIEMTGLFPFNVTTKMNYIYSALQNIMYPHNPNLPRIRGFQGGQAAYKKNSIHSTFDGFLGGPEGDTVFAAIMIKKYGEDCFAFADAPVFCKVTNPKKLSKEDVLIKIQRVLQPYLPRKCAVKLRANQPRFNKTIYYISLYSCWFRPMINKYFTTEVLTSQEVKQILTQTAKDQGFYDNPHVYRFIKNIKKDAFSVNNNQQLWKLYFEIAEHCHQPTLINHVNS